METETRDASAHLDGVRPIDLILSCCSSSKQSKTPAAPNRSAATCAPYRTPRAPQTPLFSLLVVTCR